MINKESLKAKTSEAVHPSETEKIRDFVMKDESLRHWAEEQVEDMNDIIQVNYFIRDHAVDLANTINRRLQSSENSVSTDAYRAKEEDFTRGIEGSLRALKAAPEFQMEMELGEVLPSPYENQIALDITELLKRQEELPFSLPAGFSIVIPPGASDYHAENNPVEGFQGVGAPHEWYFGGSFEIFDPNMNDIVGYGDFSVDGLWDSEDGDVIGNSLTVLNLRPGE